LIIDAHAHFIPYDYPDGSPTCFPSMEPIDGEKARILVKDDLRFKASEVFFNAERRLEALDSSGLEAEVISPMPPLLNYGISAQDGLDLSRYVNESVARLAAVDPERIIGFGMVPLQDPDLSAGELRPLMDMGLRGVEVASHINGVSLGDPQFLPFFQEAERLDLPVFVHAVAPSIGDRLPKKATASFGINTEGGLAAASIITGGTAEKCPNLRLSFSHAGGGFPLMLPRANYFWGGTWNEEPPLPEKVRESGDSVSPLEYARRFYYDALVFDRRALRYLIDLLGADRMLVGSDFPAMPREQPGTRTLDSMELSSSEFEQITWSNAMRFLGIDDPSSAARARPIPDLTIVGENH